MAKTTRKPAPQAIDDKDLEQTTGGISLLLPAVQKVREASATEPVQPGQIKAGDGSV
jgi:hypothetical protein